MLKSSYAQKKKQQGFTLVEVMVALLLVSIFIPSILLTQFTINRMAQSGINRNSAMLKSQMFRQYFIHKINASGRNVRIRDAGNTVTLELYNTLNKKWEDSSLSYLPKNQQIVYIPPGKGRKKSVLEHVHKSGTNPIFSIKDNAVKCNFFIGRRPPKKGTTTSLFSTPGVFVNLTATPRNIGDGG